MINSHTAQTLKAKYFLNVELLVLGAKIGNNPSFTWQSIFHIPGVVMRGAEMEYW
jgi:hypothetical protein